MTDKKAPTTAGATELTEEDLKKVRGGDFSLGFRPTKVEVESVYSSGNKSFKSTKA